MRIEITLEAGAMPKGMERMLCRVGDACLFAEGLSGKYQAGLVLTDDEGIRAINRAQRKTDRPTDVLSFPSVAFPFGTARDHAARLRRELDPDTGCLHLGDIVISLPRAREQAAAYGHSLFRETGFLFAHGCLHLLGYDHETEAQRAVMRAMEENAMEKTGLSRRWTDADIELMEGAREAMKRAYAPYSKYRVGACVRAGDGRLFKGCNVENASFGMTICAERNALTSAVTEGATVFDAIAIAAEGAVPYPCGACRQTMREFAKDLRVLLVCGDDIRETSLSKLLPDSFGPESLQEVEA